MIKKELPSWWAECKLEDCTHILDNLRQPVSASERARREGDIPYYGATGQAGWIDDFIFDEELILVGEDGAPFFDKQKNVAYRIEGKSWVNNHAHVLKAIDGITTNNFLLHYLNYFDYTDFVGGTTRLKLTQGSLKEIPFPLPPLAEQKRIVTKLDTAFAHLDTLKAKLERIPELLKNFRQAVLNQAVTGKLTEEIFDNSYYNEIDGRFTRNVNINAHSQDEIEFARNSFINFEFKRWKIYPLELLVELDRGIPYGIVQTGDDVEGGIKTIRAGNIKGLLINDELKKVDRSIESQYSRTRLRGGEVILSIRGTVGNAAVVPNTFAGYNISREVALVPIIKEISPKYIAILLQSPIGFKMLSEKVKGIAQRGINLSDLRRFPVPLPSLEEQNRIVEKVEALYYRADVIEMQYISLKSNLYNLPSALLSRAFDGKLVHPDETDEPANMLLERIESFKTVVHSKRNTMPESKNRRIVNKNLQTIIEEKFGQIPFSFEELTDSVDLSYEELSQKLIELTSTDNSESPLLMKYNKEANRIEFKSNK